MAKKEEKVPSISSLTGRLYLMTHDKFASVSKEGFSLSREGVRGSESGGRGGGGGGSALIKPPPALTALNAGRLLTFKSETELLAKLEISIKRSKVDPILRFFWDKSECISSECKYAG